LGRRQNNESVNYYTVTLILIGFSANEIAVAKAPQKKDTLKN
jgi:hypothetical protein